MPEEASQAPAEVTQDTPAIDAPSVEPAQQDTAPDWQKRYTDLQPEYTRTTQQLAQAEQLLVALRSDDPEVRNQAAEALGLEFEADEDDEWADPDEQRLSAIERQQQKLAEYADGQEQSKQMDAYYEYVDGKLESVVESKLGYKLDDDDIREVVGAAERLGIDQNLDEPDWEGATKWFQARLDAQIERYKSTKRSQFVSPVGQAGSSKPNLDNDSDRQDYLAALLQAG